MELSFSRMNGLGNRFAIVDVRAQPLSPAQIKTLACEIKGIDQLLLLEAPRAKSEAAALFMGIYNKDGTQAKACGNGVRCVAWLALEAMKADGKNSDEITIDTLGGVIACRRKDEKIEATMGVPKWQWADIPLSTPRDTLNLSFSSVPPSLGLGTAISVGNPHLVFFPNELATGLDWRALGADLTQDPLFPEGVNVSFVIVKDTGLEVKVWERGAGATLACGTAACAALVAACRRFPVMPRALPVHLPGGVLEIHWRKQDSQVLMTGAVSWEGVETTHV